MLKPFTESHLKRSYNNGRFDNVPGEQGVYRKAVFKMFIPSDTPWHMYVSSTLKTTYAIDPSFAMLWDFSDGYEIHFSGYPGEIARKLNKLCEYQVFKEMLGSGYDDFIAAYQADTTSEEVEFTYTPPLVSMEMNGLVLVKYDPETKFLVELLSGTRYELSDTYATGFDNENILLLVQEDYGINIYPVGQLNGIARNELDGLAVSTRDLKEVHA